MQTLFAQQAAEENPITFSTDEAGEIQWQSRDVWRRISKDVLRAVYPARLTRLEVASLVLDAGNLIAQLELHGEDSLAAKLDRAPEDLRLAQVAAAFSFEVVGGPK